MDELKHAPVPGYPRAFAIAFGVMALYLALILVSSPGKADKHGKKTGAPASSSTSS